MASMTIRDLDEGLKARLRVRAAEHDRSMEEEARAILRAALCVEPAETGSLVATIRSRLKHVGGVDLDIPARDAMRDPLAGDS